MGSDVIDALLAEAREATSKELSLSDFMSLKHRLRRLEQDAGTSEEARAELETAEHRLILATGYGEMGWDPDSP